MRNDMRSAKRQYWQKALRIKAWISIKIKEIKKFKTANAFKNLRIESFLSSKYKTERKIIKRKEKAPKRAVGIPKI